MAELCICSDVTENHILVNISSLLQIDRILSLEVLKKDVWFLRFQDQGLLEIKNELIGVLDKLLSEREPIKEMSKRIISNGKEIEFRKTTIISISYKGKEIKVDLKNNDDFRICVLIDLLNLLEVTFNLNGILFLYNRTEIEKYNGVEIISLLRAMYSLSEEELAAQMKLKLQNQNSLEKMSSLISDINMLRKAGLLYYDKELRKYTLTGRGYIFW
ncbi:MAG: hypothetical protein ACTHMV_10380 [Chitinophagaceae bacterium]